MDSDLIPVVIWLLAGCLGGLYLARREDLNPIVGSLVSLVVVPVLVAFWWVVVIWVAARSIRARQTKRRRAELLERCKTNSFDSGSAAEERRRVQAREASLRRRERREKRLLAQAVGGKSVKREKSPQNRRKKRIPASLRAEILVRDSFTCQWCNRNRDYLPDGVTLHIDHRVPVARGGKTVRTNLQVLCSECNLGKGAKYSI